MKYKLYPGSLNDLSRVQETVFKNRNCYPCHDDPCSNIKNHYSLKDMNVAVSVFESSIKELPNIDIVVDSDFDGYASASILYRYIKENYPNKKITYHLHEGKQHGLSDDIPWQQFENSLVLIPDAGSNDVEQCRFLYEQCNCSIIVLDHHQIDEENNFAVIVNSQINGYSNPYLCGTGVTWKFIMALDEANWTECAPDYIDVVAMATVADIMDVTTPENRSIIDIGLKAQNHPLLISLADKAGISLEGITGMDAQFSIVPLVNSMIRVGGSEEKELLFRAFCTEYEIFDYKKRNSDEVIEEDIYDRAARLCYNAKSRQKRSRNNDLEVIIQQIVDKGLDDNKVIVVNGTASNQALTGVLAAQISEKYKKPCLVLRRKPVIDEDQPIIYGGSGRNSMITGVQNFKELLESTGMFKLVSGHNNAFGVEIDRKMIPGMIQELNNLLPNLDEPCINADFIIGSSDLCFETAANFAKLIRPYCGEGFPEPIVVAENITVRRDQVSFMGGGTTWKITSDEDIEIVKFGVNEHDFVVGWYNNTNEKTFKMNVAGTLGMNQWRGVVSAQMVVKEYEAWQNS